MTINLKSLSITNYDSKKVENVKFLREIEKDKEISQNIEDVKTSLEKSIGLSNFRLGVSYLVKENEELIGLVKLADKNTQEHSLSIDIAICEAHRDKGYGEILFSEISDFIFRNSNLIKKVKLVNYIDKNESKQKVLVK